MKEPPFLTLTAGMITTDISPPGLGAIKGLHDRVIPYVVSDFLSLIKGIT